MKGKKLIMDCCFKSYKEFEEAYNEINVISSVSRNQSFFKEAHKFINDNIIELPYSCDIFIEDVTGPAGTVKELPGNHTPKLKTSVLDKIWQFIVKCWNSIGKFFNIIIKLVKNIAGNTEKLLARFDKVCELLSDKFGKDTAKMQECFRKSDEKTEQAIYDSIAEEYKSLFGNTEAIAPNLKSELNEVVKIAASKKSSKDKAANRDAAIAINLNSNFIAKARLVGYLNELLVLVNIFYLSSKGSIIAGSRSIQLAPADVQSLKSISLDYKNSLMELHNHWKNSIYNKHKFFILITKNIVDEVQRFQQIAKGLADKVDEARKKLFDALAKTKLPMGAESDSRLLEIFEKLKLFANENSNTLDIASEIYKLLVSLYNEIYNGNKNNPNPTVTALIDIFSQPITALSGASTEISTAIAKKTNDSKALVTINNRITNELTKIEKEPIKDNGEEPVKDAEITGFTPYEDDEQKQIRGPKGPKALLGSPNLAVTKYKKPGPIVKHKPEEGGPVVKAEDKAKKPKGGIINILIVTIKETYVNVVTYIKNHKILQLTFYSLFIAGVIATVSLVFGEVGNYTNWVSQLSGGLDSLYKLGAHSITEITNMLTKHPYLESLAKQCMQNNGFGNVDTAKYLQAVHKVGYTSGEYILMNLKGFQDLLWQSIRNVWSQGGNLTAALGAGLAATNMSKLFKAIQFWKKG